MLPVEQAKDNSNEALSMLRCALNGTHSRVTLNEAILKALGHSARGRAAPNSMPLMTALR